MQRQWKSVMAAMLFAIVGTTSAQAQGAAGVEKAPTGKPLGSTEDRTSINQLFAAYNKALNTSDTAAVLPLYTDDGIFMAPYSQSAIGHAAVKQAYDTVFSKISFAVKFDIAEIIQVGPEWAFVRTNSAGTTTAHATGAKSSEGNQELFVLKKGSDGKWRIARYSFSPTSPEKS